jgi:DNA-binding Lrp family transcriptional regulator
MNTKKNAKLALLKLFKEGKSEVEAHEEISKSHSLSNISEKSVNNWFEDFNLENCSLNDSIQDNLKEKLTDEQIIDLINKNPDLSMEKIAKLAKCSTSAIRNRINKLNNNGKSTNYRKKDNTKITDEYLIDLIDRKPDLSIEKLSKFSGCSTMAIQSRIIKLNNSGQKVNYIKKDNFIFSDEYLIELVDKNPDLNMRELARLAGTSQVTISNRIKQIKSMGKSIRYISKKYSKPKPESNAEPNPKLTDEYLVNLVNENPGLSMEKLAILANISHTTMWRRIKKINRYSEGEVYHNKDCKKFTDEHLINLINENPDLSLAKLAVLTGTSISSISDRINQINSDGEKVNYCNKGEKKFTDEQLIDLITSNPDFSMEKLSTLTNTSSKTISSRIKKIDSGNEKSQYVSKGPGPKVIEKLPDETLIDLINKNPGLNLKELAKLTDRSASTISYRIKKINRDEERVKYVSKRNKNKNIE